MQKLDGCEKTGGDAEANPTPNDRNAESDPRRNFLKELKSLEQVTEP